MQNLKESVRYDRETSNTVALDASVARVCEDENGVTCQRSNHSFISAGNKDFLECSRQGICC